MFLSIKRNHSMHGLLERERDLAYKSFNEWFGLLKERERRLSKTFPLVKEIIQCMVF